MPPPKSPTTIALALCPMLPSVWIFLPHPFKPIHLYNPYVSHHKLSPQVDLLKMNHKLSPQENKIWTNQWNCIELSWFIAILCTQIQLLNFLWLQTAFDGEKCGWSNIQLPTGYTNENSIALHEKQKINIRYFTLKIKNKTQAEGIFQQPIKPLYEHL